jgi:hypothetical protein
MTKFRVRDPVPALLHNPGGHREYVSLPIGAVVSSLREVSMPVIGMFKVIWANRQYDVLGADLLRKCEPLRTA